MSRLVTLASKAKADTLPISRVPAAKPGHDTDVSRRPVVESETTSWPLDNKRTRRSPSSDNLTLLARSCPGGSALSSRTEGKSQSLTTPSDDKAAKRVPLPFSHPDNMVPPRPPTIQSSLLLLSA